MYVRWYYRTTSTTTVQHTTVVVLGVLLRMYVVHVNLLLRSLRLLVSDITFSATYHIISYHRVAPRDRQGTHEECRSLPCIPQHQV